MTLPFCNFSIKRDLINLYFKGQDNVADYVPFTSKPKTVRTIISNVSDGKMYFANVIICRSDLWGFLHQTCRDVRLAFHTRLLRLIQYFALNHHLHIYHSHCVTCLFLQSDLKLWISSVSWSLQTLIPVPQNTLSVWRAPRCPDIFPLACTTYGGILKLE